MTAATLKDELNALLEPEEKLQRIEILDWNDFPIGITGKTLKRVFRLRTEASRAVASLARPLGAQSARPHMSRIRGTSRLHSS